MIWRVDLLLWGLAAASVGVAAALRLTETSTRSRRPTVQAALAGLAFLALLLGLAWRGWASISPSNAGTASALASIAAGAVACGLWQDWRDRRRRLAGARPNQAHPHALALFGTVMLILLAVAAGWAFRTASLSLPASTWLYGLRDLVAGLGLGGWLFMAAGAAYSGVTHARQRLRRYGVDTSVQAGAANGVASPAMHDGIVASPEVMATAGASVAAQPAGSAARYAAPASHGARNLSDAALRFSYPWLTAALIAGGIWSLVVYATPWRGRPYELWLAVAWLLGGAYLHAVAGWRTPQLARFWASLLAVLGLLASLLAAWQAPTLFT